MTPRELMTEYLSAAKRGDWETAFGYYEDDIVVHIPGRSTFAGDHRGKDAAVEYIQTIRDHYRDGEIQLELIDMLVSNDRVALLVRERFLRDDAIVEISIFEADQYAVDALLEEVRP